MFCAVPLGVEVSWLKLSALGLTISRSLLINYETWNFLKSDILNGLSLYTQVFRFGSYSHGFCSTSLFPVLMTLISWPFFRIPAPSVWICHQRRSVLGAGSTLPATEHLWFQYQCAGPCMTSSKRQPWINKLFIYLFDHSIGCDGTGSATLQGGRYCNGRVVCGARTRLMLLNSGKCGFQHDAHSNHGKWCWCTGS